MSAILDPAPRTKLSRIIKSRSAMVDRLAEVEQRLAVLPVLEADARVEALQRSPENPVVVDELAIAHERSALQSELAELAGNLVAADRVLTEAQAEHDATLRADARAEAEQLLGEELVLWRDAATKFVAFRDVYERLCAHVLRVAATRPSAYLDGVDPLAVTPFPVTFDSFLSVLAAAGRPDEYEAKMVDSAGILRSLVPAFRDPKPELSGDFSSRRQPVANR